MTQLDGLIETRDRVGGEAALGDAMAMVSVESTPLVNVLCMR